MADSCNHFSFSGAAGSFEMSPSLPGPPGPAGKSAYEAAVEGGYNGTEEQFNAALAEIDTALHTSDVDAELSDSSTNPVQNKVVAGAFANLPTPSTEIAEDDLTAIGFTITSANRWAAISETSQSEAGVLEIPAGTRRIRISPSATGTNVWAFLNSVNTTAATPDFSASYPGRITATGGDPIEYEVESDMRFVYLLKKTTAGVDVFPTQVLLNPIQTDATLSQAGVPADAAATGARIEELEAELDGKAPVIYDTASGAVASFPDGADNMPINSLVVNIEPVQAGGGEPSPTNIRPISGWTGCNISHSGADTSNPTVIPISWQTEASTVYGGTLNIEEGTLTAVLARHVFDGTETFGHVSNAIVWLSVPTAKMLGAGGGSHVNTLKCSHLAPALRYISTAEQRINAICPWLANGKHQFIIGYVTGVSSDEEMVAYLQQQYAAGTPVAVGYELDQPVTYQLSLPEMQDFLKTLYGENNIWADCGPVTVEYPADTKLYIDARVNATRAMIAGIEADMTASRAYATGDLLIVGDTLYKAAAPIASGAALTPGTNVNATTVAEQLLLLFNS